MKTAFTQLNTRYFAIAWTSLVAIAPFLAPAAHAQSNNVGNQTISWVPIVPGSPQSLPTSIETIGMRQERINGAILQNTQLLAHPGMSPAWFGIATALDVIAATGSTGNVLAVQTVAPAIRSTNLGDAHALLAYSMRVQACENALDVLQARSVQFSGDTQSEFRDAMREVGVRKEKLELQIIAADASTAANWNQNQADLADAYSHYATATARVERLTSI